MQELSHLTCKSHCYKHPVWKVKGLLSRNIISEGKSLGIGLVFFFFLEKIIINAAKTKRRDSTGICLGNAICSSPALIFDRAIFLTESRLGLGQQRWLPGRSQRNKSHFPVSWLAEN